MKKIIKALSNYRVVDFQSNSLAEKYVDIYYERKDGFIGNLFSSKAKVKRVLLPSNTKITRIENNKPNVGDVTITYVKK